MFSMNSLSNKKISFAPESIKDLLNYHYSDLISEFYEMQSTYLSIKYKKHKSIESSTIIMCFVRDVHLHIVRQRERELNYDVSLKKFFFNLKNIEIPTQKIVSVVNTTGIPKETVRRKIKQLIQKDIIHLQRNKEYYWNVNSKNEDFYLKTKQKEIRMISKFVHCFTKYLHLTFTVKEIEDEISSQFSFYFYHFLNCQLKWLKMWQTKIKDIDLIFIAMQALIPTLKYSEKNMDTRKIGIDNLHTIIGSASQKYKLSDSSINASSVSDVSGIPRATCIRKLEKLVKLGLLVREMKTKRYYVNQFAHDRTKHITQKENVISTVNFFSNFLSTVIFALTRNQKN